MFYRQKLIELYKHPSNQKEILNPDVSHTQENVTCGDVASIFFKIENGMVIDVGFKGHGCVLAIAGTDIACNLIKSKKLKDIQSIKNEDIIKELGLENIGYNRYDCVTLGLKALNEALKKWKF